MEKKEIMDILREKLDKNNDTYYKELLQCSPSVLIGRAGEIHATRIVYNQLYAGEYPENFLEYLLRFQNPLEVVRDQWISEQSVLRSEDMEHILWNFSDKRDAEQDYELDANFLPPEQEVRMC